MQEFDQADFYAMERSEIITVERRRRWSLSDKRRIVGETMAPGSSVSAVARRYGMHASQVFAWRRELRGEAGGGDGPAGGGMFAPLVATPGSTAWGAEAGGGGRMEIVLGSGRRIIVDASVDGAALSRVVAVLEQR